MIDVLNVLFYISLGLAFVQGLLLLAPPIVMQANNSFTRWLLGGKNGRNNAIWVVMKPNIKEYNAILQQEIYECEQKKNIVTLFMTFFSAKVRRDIELTGQEIQVQVALTYNPDLNEQEYRHQQAVDLSHFYKDFKSFTTKDIEAMMLARKSKALAWLKQI